MPRPAYKITANDFANARRYIENAMARDDISNVDGYMAFRHAHTPELLQSWCDNYLPDTVFKKLKNAILAARKRNKDTKIKQPKVGIDLSHEAYHSLSFISNELGCPLSETILEMEKAYWLAKDNGLLK